MQVKDKIMYHYHKNGIHDDIWVVGNEFMVDETFQSHYGLILNLFSTAVTCNPDNHLSSFGDVLDYYLKEEVLEKQDKEMIRKMLEESRKIIKNIDIFKRELALEQYREKFHQDIPSRLNSIWVADSNQLNFWKKELNDNSILFKVSLTGTLFKSSDTFIPNNNLNMIESFETAKNYWNPVFQTAEDEEKAEYLFQGKVKILSKVEP